MIGLSDFLWGGVLPATVAVCAFTVVWRMTANGASAWRTALVAGYVAGQWALDARNIGATPALLKSFRPTESRDWLPLLLLLAILPDAIACVGRRGPLVGWVLRIALCVFVPWRLLHGSKYLPLSLGEDFGFDFGGWSTVEMIVWLGGIAGLMLASWQTMRYAHSGETAGETAHARTALASLVACGAAITAAWSSSLIYGQLLGVLTVALAGCGVASILWKTHRAPDAAAGPLVIVLSSLLALAYFFAELRIHNGLLLLTAMPVAVGWLPLPAKWPLRWRTACRFAICLTLIGIAVTLAGVDFAAAQAEKASNPYSGYAP